MNTLSTALRSEASWNLNALRLLLAAAVIVSHAWPLALGAGTPEPLQALTGRSLGGWAVGAFFFISGLLISTSAARKAAIPFWTARFRRIVPGLGVALLVTLALAMLSGSTANLGEAAKWFVRAITLASIEHRLTGAFAANPFPEVVNGPLWSLFHEVLAYFLCWIFVVVFGSRKGLPFVVLGVLAAAMAAFHEALPWRLPVFAPLFGAFTFGMAVQVFASRIPVSPLLALAAFISIALLPEMVALGPVSLSLVVLALWLPPLRFEADASYGLYIYGWPVAQTIVALQPGIQPVTLAVMSVAVTYPLALLSWSCVERPSLSRNRAMA